jgi:hypothetical protein
MIQLNHAVSFTWDKKATGQHFGKLDRPLDAADPPDPAEAGLFAG